MDEIFNFALVALMVVLSIYIILKILIKKFNPEKSKVKLYGILKGMTNFEIISISCIIINFVYLLYLMVSFININYYLISISLFLVVIGDAFIKNKKIIINIFLYLISLGAIKVTYLIHDYITNEYMSVWMLLLLVFVMIFVFLYLCYNLLRGLNSVVLANKYIRKGVK